MATHVTNLGSIFGPDAPLAPSKPAPSKLGWFEWLLIAGAGLTVVTVIAKSRETFQSRA